MGKKETVVAKNKMTFQDVVLMARAIEGEGAGGFGNKRAHVALWVGHAIMNLYEAKWQRGRWPTPGAVVEDRFHGYVRVKEPADWSLMIAHACLQRRHDITGAALAMLSAADLRAHKWPLRDDILLRAFTAPSGAALRFYRTWAEEWT